MPMLVEAFLGFLILLAVTNIVFALRRGRIQWGQSFTRSLWAEREDSPDLFWLVVGLNALAAVTLAWLLFTDTGSRLG